MWLTVDPVHFDDVQVVIVNGEHEVRVAGHVDQTNPVSGSHENQHCRVDASRIYTRRLPNCTLTTANADAGPLENRPKPLINVASDTGGTPTGSFLASVWYQSARVRIVESDFEY